MRLFFYIIMFFGLIFIVVLNPETISFNYWIKQSIQIPKPYLILLPMLAACMAVAGAAYGQIQKMMNRASALEKENSELKNRITGLENQAAGTATGVAGRQVSNPLAAQAEVVSYLSQPRKTTLARELIRAAVLIAIFIVSVYLLRWNPVFFMTTVAPVLFLIVEYGMMKGAKLRLVNEQRLDKNGLAVIEFMEGPLFVILFVVNIVVVYSVLFAYMFSIK